METQVLFTCCFVFVFVKEKIEDKRGKKHFIKKNYFVFKLTFL